MQGWKLLVVQFYGATAARPTASRCWRSTRWAPAAAQRVMLSSDGKGTRELLNSDTTPVRWSVMGIED